MVDALLPRPLEPAKPTSLWAKLLPGLIGAGVGAGAVLLVGSLLPALPDLSLWTLLGFGALVAVSAWVHILLHEAGHAVAGIAVGLQPLAFGVGPIRAERSGEGWRFRWGGSVAGIAGFAALLPRADAPPSLGGQAVYLLGGPLTNLLLAAASGLVLLAVDLPAMAYAGLVVFLLIGLAIGIVNLVPFETGGWLSDGAGLRLLRRDPGAMLAGMRVQQVVQSSMDGRRPRNWPAELLDAGPLPALPPASPWILASVLLRLSRAIDAGAREDAEACAAYLADYWPASKPPERPGIALSMAVYAALAVDDADGSTALLAAWRPLGGGGLLDSSAHEAWLDAELALRQGRLDEARQRLLAARAALPRIHDAGTRVPVGERLDVLEARLAAAM